MLEVERLLVMTRLLTLTGVGGSGKTRLALEVARDLVDTYSDGVWLVELAPLGEGELVPKAVAEALEIAERPAEALTEILVEVLGTRELLLVVDNCEHLLEASAHLVDVLLDSCEGLRILATSREGLGVEGEVRWPVPPLSVPDPRSIPSSEELEAYESVRLFIERARGRNPSFSLSPRNVVLVVEICSKLEGIPLAIELAAARVGTLSLEQISERLTDSLKLLTGGGRTQVPKQRTLRGTLDWSHELLSEEERRLFGRLSVFAGGWTLEAAEAVGAGRGVEEEDILDLLSGLVEKSLVVAESAEGGRVRYRMLEQVRQYAREKLEECGEEEDVRYRHANFFLNLAEDAKPKLRGPEDVEWIERLEADHDNLRAALSWMLGRGEAELALRLAGALWRFWHAHGHLGEGRKWLEEALAMDDRTAPVAARVKALEALFWLAYDQADLDRAEAAALEGLELSYEADAGNSLAASFQALLAKPAWVRGDYERAKGLLEESLVLSRKSDDKVKIAEALLPLGGTTNALGDYARAKEIFEEGIALCRELGYTYRLPSFLYSLGYTSLLEGNYERAAALNEEAATLFRERGYKGNLQYALDNLGWVALLRGDSERARSYYEEALMLCRELGDKMIAAESLEGLACVAGAEGEALRAARLFGAADALRKAVGYPHTAEEEAWREPYRGRVRSRLGEAGWEEAVAEGGAMDLEEAIQYALSQEKPPTATTLPSTPEQPHPGGLTSREVEVLGLVAEGLTNVEVAQTLFLSPRTVDTHLTSIYHKLGVSSRAAATHFAVDHGLA